MEDNNMTIRAHTQCTYQEMKAFQNFHLRKARGVSLLLLLGWVAVNLYFRVTKQVWFANTLTTFLLGILLLLFCALVFNGIFYTKKRHEEATHMLQHGFFYEFRENGFVARNNTPDFTGQKEFAYSELYHVFKRGDFLYIYPAKKDSFIIDLNRVGEGRAEELIARLKQKCKKGCYKSRI